MKTAAFGLASCTITPSPNELHQRRRTGGPGGTVRSESLRRDQAARYARIPSQSSTAAPTTLSTR